MTIAQRAAGEKSAGHAGSLDVRGLSVSYVTRGGAKPVVVDVSFSVAPGEALGIVGESGSGKSTAVVGAIGLLDRGTADVVAERSSFGGQDLLTAAGGNIRLLGPRIGVVFQNPLVALNPVLTIGRQLTDHMRFHLRIGAAPARRRAIALLAEVGIPDAGRRLDSFPHQFSGGMLQRVTIAMALACDPDLLVADEPTTALDATVQADVVDLVLSLQRSRSLSLIWITHDLGLLSRIATRVAVMYAGRLVEVGPVEVILNRPAHPYTQGLLAAVKSLWRSEGDVFETVPGSPVRDLSTVTGCAFAPRCRRASGQCRGERPLLRAIGDARDHDVACWHAGFADADSGEAPSGDAGR